MGGVDARFLWSVEVVVDMRESEFLGVLGFLGEAALFPNFRELVKFCSRILKDLVSIVSCSCTVGSAGTGR